MHQPITFSPVHGTVFAPIYHTERCFLRSTSRANALTIQNFPTSVQELSSELTVLTFKLSNQITLQQPVDTTAISRTDGRSRSQTNCRRQEGIVDTGRWDTEIAIANTRWPLGFLVKREKNRSTAGKRKTRASVVWHG